MELKAKDGYRSEVLRPLGADALNSLMSLYQPAHRAGQSGGVFAMTRDQIFHIIPLSIRPFQCHYRKLCNH